MKASKTDNNSRNSPSSTSSVSSGNSKISNYRKNASSSKTNSNLAQKQKQAAKFQGNTLNKQAEFFTPHDINNNKNTRNRSNSTNFGILANNHNNDNSRNNNNARNSNNASNNTDASNNIYYDSRARSSTIGNFKKPKNTNFKHDQFRNASHGNRGRRRSISERIVKNVGGGGVKRSGLR